MYIVIHAHQGTVKFGSATEDLAVVSEEMNAVEFLGWNNGYLTIETTDPGGAIDSTMKAKKEKEEEYKKQDEAFQKERADRLAAEQPAEEAKKGKPEADHRASKDETPAAHRSSR